MWLFWWIGIPAAVAIVGSVLLLRTLRRHSSPSLSAARETFQLRREWLEADFVRQASASGKPRGLHWVDCDFEDSVEFARERKTGRFRALVGVTISFEAIEGGGMEDVEAVANSKAATVVFRLDGPEWQADGRAYFNLSPLQTIEHYNQELETAE